MSHYPIRPVSMADLPAILRIEHLSFAEEAFDWEDFLGFFRHAPTTFLVAEDDGEVIGYITAHPDWDDPDSGYIASLAVLPSYRRLGVGTALIAAVTAIFAERDTRRMALHVRVENTAAIRLYESNGFRVAATVPHYYGQGEAAYFMVRGAESDVQH
jgi:ribosomal-protein-alanine N-acetyltransferase